MMFRNAMKKGFGISAALILATMSANLAHAGAVYDGLSDADKATLNAGGQVVLPIVRDGNWPEISVIQLVKSTSEEVAAVMFDYDNHKVNLPNITASKAAVPGAAKTTVDYTITLPPVPLLQKFGLTSASYQVEDVLTSPKAETFKISWKKSKFNLLLNDVQGGAVFEPVRDGALVKYTNKITPRLVPANEDNLNQGIGPMTQVIQDTVAALVKKAEEGHVNQTDAFKKTVATLRKALGLSAAPAETE